MLESIAGGVIGPEMALPQVWRALGGLKTYGARARRACRHNTGVVRTVAEYRERPELAYALDAGEASILTGRDRLMPGCDAIGVKL